MAASVEGLSVRAFDHELRAPQRDILAESLGAPHPEWCPLFVQGALCTLSVSHEFRFESILTTASTA
jgi:hypothetical protein